MSVCVWVGGGMALWLMCACAWGVICVRVGYVARGVGISSYDLKRASDLGFQEPRTSLRLCARTQQVCVRARAPLQHCLFPSPSFPSISVLPIFCPHTYTHSNLPYPPIRPFPPLIENSTTGRHCSGQKLCESEETIYGSNRCVVTSDQYGGFSCKRKKEVVTA